MNIIMCVTPLQMLIAENLIKENKNQEFLVLILSYDKNSKYNYYINKLKMLSSELIHYNVDTDSKLLRLKEMILFKKKIRCLNNSQFDKVYLASIENPFLLLTISLIKFKILNTFDDGTANINQNSIYYRDLKINAFEKIIRRIIGVKYSKERLIQISEAHYTLYPTFDNIIKNIIAIQFPSVNVSKSFVESGDKKKISIYLGQPLSQENEYFDSTFIENILNKYDIDYYFPHPRERIRIEGAEYIDSPLIFEEYLLDLLNKNYTVDLYTFFSTAALNVSNFENVKIFCLRDSYLENKYAGVYSIFKKLNISFVDIA